MFIVVCDCFLGPKSEPKPFGKELRPSLARVLCDQNLPWGIKGILLLLLIITDDADTLTRPWAVGPANFGILSGSRVTGFVMLLYV